MTNTAERKLMLVAIEEAKRSVVEDDRPHPYVGAALADQDGKLLVTAHRGEAAGAHAEFTLFEKAASMGISPAGKVLFVTLEPCTQRGVGKIPCAARVMGSGVATVYIGNLDPNPTITGSAVVFLRTKGIAVKSFDDDLTGQLRELNADFFDAYEELHAPPFAGTGPEGGEAEMAGPVDTGKRRDGLLLLSARMIWSARKSILMLGGQLSWLREVAPILQHAAHCGIDVAVQCARPTDGKEEAEFEVRCSNARALGARISVAHSPQSLRGLLIDEGSSRAECLLLEPSPSLHGTLLREPHDGRLLGAVGTSARTTFSNGYVTPVKHPEYLEVERDSLAGLLRGRVMAYANATISIERVHPADTLPLSTTLERLKLLRARLTLKMQRDFGMPSVGLLRGSSWPIMPPVIEQSPDGALIVIDGTHRVYEARRRGDQSIEAIVVRAAGPLPASPLDSWERVVFERRRVTRDRRYSGYVSALFRPLDEAIKSKDLVAVAPRV